MDEEVIFVIAEESGERLDALLSHNIEDLSRNAIQNLIDADKVTLNGDAIKKNYKAKAGDAFRVVIPSPTDSKLIPEDIPLDIIFEDNDVIVINKPRGMVVHPAPGHASGTLVNALLYHFGDSLSGIGGEKRPGIVHRIDKDTSGLLIVAKNDFSHNFLSQQLSNHTLSRKYEAIVHGNFKDASGTIDKPIGRNLNDRKKMTVTDKNSRNAITHWELINNYKNYSHIRCILETGRTHQIRVHMSSIGHVLLGDSTYGAPSPEKGLEGQCLHAKELQFIHPRSNELIVLSTDLPEYFKEVLNHLGPII